jgi:hypothetical protein
MSSAGRAFDELKVMLEEIEERAGECPEAQRYAKRFKKPPPSISS